MKNNLKTHFKRAYWLVAKGLSCILGLALAIHCILENAAILKISQFFFYAGVIMLVGGIIVSGVCRHITLINKGKQQEKAEKLAREKANFLKEQKVAEAQDVLEGNKTQKQHELYVRRMFREIS